ncbi:MAG: hypothetical protein ACJAXJ_003394 [Colwellia sp.]|jgi:hypothetical protein
MIFKITDNKDDMDIDAIHEYLSRSYWAKDVPKSVATKDAHGLYEQYGFRGLTDQTMFMQLWTPDIYSQTS